MNSPPSACARPIRGVGDETNPWGRRQTRRPPQKQTPNRLGARQACLKTPAAQIRKTRAPRTARIEPNKCLSGAKRRQDKTTAARNGVDNRRSRGASAKLRRRRTPDGTEKAQPTPSPSASGRQSESGFSAMRKSRRATRGVRAQPQFSRSRARRSQRDLFFCNAPRTRPTAGLIFPSGSWALEQTPTATRRGAKLALAASRAPRAAEPQDNANWKTSRGRTAGQAHRAQSGAPQAKSTGEAARKQQPAPKPFPKQRRQPEGLPARPRAAIQPTAPQLSKL